MQDCSTADSLGVSEEALALFVDADAIDLHIDSFIWHRVFGYDLGRAHRGGFLGRGFFGARGLSHRGRVGPWRCDLGHHDQPPPWGGRPRAGLRGRTSNA